MEPAPAVNANFNAGVHHARPRCDRHLAQSRSGRRAVAPDLQQSGVPIDKHQRAEVTSRQGGGAASAANRAHLNSKWFTRGPIRWCIMDTAIHLPILEISPQKSVGGMHCIAMVTTAADALQLVLAILPNRRIRRDLQPCRSESLWRGLPRFAQDLSAPIAYLPGAAMISVENKASDIDSNTAFPALRHSEARTGTWQEQLQRHHQAPGAAEPGALRGAAKSSHEVGATKMATIRKTSCAQ